MEENKIEEIKEEDDKGKEEVNYTEPPRVYQILTKQELFDKERLYKKTPEGFLFVENPIGSKLFRPVLKEELQILQQQTIINKKEKLDKYQKEKEEEEENKDEEILNVKKPKTNSVVIPEDEPVSIGENLKLLLRKGSFYLAASAGLLLALSFAF